MSAFLAKIILLLKAIEWELYLKFFSSVFRFCKIKGYYSWKCKFYRPCIRNPAYELLQIGDKLEKNNVVTICWCGVIVNFFWRYWPTFHLNIINSSGVMKIFLDEGLIRNPDIGNIPVWVSPSIWRVGRFRDSKFGTNVSNEMLLNAAKC